MRQDVNQALPGETTEPDASLGAATPAEASQLENDDAASVDPSSEDASPTEDAGTTTPEAGPPPVSCDQDGDGHMAAGLPCLGDDCCDADPNVHPGQTTYFTTSSRCGTFDYDCDNAATPQYGAANCQWVGVGCAGDGFDQTTACGVTAAFSVCASGGILSCTANVGSLTQACR